MASCASPWKCCICLDDFSDPVTTPCGHNFCLACINAYWDGAAAAAQCPLCQQLFKKRPQLRVNLMLRDLILQRSGGAQQGAPKEEGKGEGEEEGEEEERGRGVPCDACPPEAEGGLAATASCLHCEESFCAEHLKPHQQRDELKNHELMEPVSRLKDRVCKQHKAPLELVCCRDLTCVCLKCAKSDHRDHKCVPLTRRLKRKKEQVELELADVKVEMKTLKAMERGFDAARDISQGNTRVDLGDALRIYAQLGQVMELNRLALVTTLGVLQRKAENRFAAMEERVQEELGELDERQEELQTLAHTSDDLAFLKASQSRSEPPTTSDWSEISAYSDAGVGTVRAAIGRLLVELHGAAALHKNELVKKEIKRAQQYAVDVTLDSNTANPLLIVSKDGKQVRKGSTPQDVPDNEERFDVLLGVLGKEGYSSGAFYFEVQAEDKDSWDIGVALETVERKQESSVSLGSGFAALLVRGGTVFASRDPAPVLVELPKPPSRVGVFVDHEEGEVCFYDVGNRNHIYSFTHCDFSKKKLLPYLNPCSSNDEGNAGPLLITPLKVKSQKSDGGESVGARAAAGGAKTSAGENKKGGTRATLSEQRPPPPNDASERPAPDPQPQAADGAPQGGGGDDAGAARQSEKSDKSEKGSDASEALRSQQEAAKSPGQEGQQNCILS